VGRFSCRQLFEKIAFHLHEFTGVCTVEFVHRKTVNDQIGCLAVIQTFFTDVIHVILTCEEGFIRSIPKVDRVIMFALKMIFGGLDSKPGLPEAGRDLAVFPLAVPSLAGPGAIMAVIVLTDDDVYTVPEQVQTGLVMLVVLLVTYIFLRFSDVILRVIGQQGAAVLVRVMGIILASLAVEIVLTALAVGSWGLPKTP